MDPSAANPLGELLQRAFAAGDGSVSISRKSLGHCLEAEELTYLSSQLAGKHGEWVKTLDLHDAGLTSDGMASIAPMIAGLANLVALRLDSNDIGNRGVRELARAIRKVTLPLLRSLNLSRIGLSTGVKSLGVIAKRTRELRELYLSGNDFACDELALLDYGPKHWPHLEVLDLSDNDIFDRSVLWIVNSPPWTTSLRRLVLRGVDLGNEFPADVLETGDPCVIRQFLSTGETPSSSPVGRLKVLVLGQGRVGKTHLIRRVFENAPRYYNPREPYTQDFTRTEWETEYSFGDCDCHLDPMVPFDGTLHKDLHLHNDARCRVHIWDFGGQEHLHSSHRLFLSSDFTVYVIVCDARKTRAENRLDYWLRMVRKEASSESSVIIAVNKCDLMDDETGEEVQRRLEALDEEQLRRVSGVTPIKFGWDGGNWTIDLKVVDGLGWHDDIPRMQRHAAGERHESALVSLRNYLVLFMEYTRSMRVRYPKGVRQVVQWCEDAAFVGNDGRPLSHIAMSAFVNACRDALLREERSEDVLRIVCSVGLAHSVLTSRQVRRGEPLAEVIFNPEWLRGPVYRLLSNQDARSRRGRLTWVDIEACLPDRPADPTAKEVWGRVAFGARERVWVMDLLIAHELVYAIERGSRMRTYFIPDHLVARGRGGPPPGRFVWQRDFEWLPEAEFGRLLGRLHQQAPEDPAALWRDEITLRVNRRARVTVRACDAVRGRGATTGVGISLYVAVSGCSGPDATRLMDMVDMELRAVLGEPAIGKGKWIQVRGAEGVDTNSVDYPEYAQWAVRVYQAAKVVHDKGAFEVNSWELLVECAKRVVEALEEREPDPELAAAVGRASRDMDTFQRYCRVAGLRAWWSTRGRRKDRAGNWEEDGLDELGP